MDLHAAASNESCASPYFYAASRAGGPGKCFKPFCYKGAIAGAGDLWSGCRAPAEWNCGTCDGTYNDCTHAHDADFRCKVPPAALRRVRVCKGEHVSSRLRHVRCFGSAQTAALTTKVAAGGAAKEMRKTKSSLLQEVPRCRVLR